MSLLPFRNLIPLFLLVSDLLTVILNYVQRRIYNVAYPFVSLLPCQKTYVFITVYKSVSEPMGCAPLLGREVGFGNFKDTVSHFYKLDAHPTSNFAIAHAYGLH